MCTPICHPDVITFCLLLDDNTNSVAVERSLVSFFTSLTHSSPLLILTCIYLPLFFFCAQLAYDESNGLKHFRTYFAINLAWWHTFKHACYQIWKRFAAMWWTPIHHHLWPGVNYFPKPGSFAYIQAFLQSMLLSYPNWAEHLRTALEGDIPLTSRVALKDLQFLLEFAIPVVPCFMMLFGECFISPQPQYYY